MIKFNIFFISSIFLLILSTVCTIAFGTLINMNTSFLIFILISFGILLRAYKYQINSNLKKYNLIYISQILFYLFYILDIFIFKISATNIKVLLLFIPAIIPVIIFFKSRKVIFVK